MNSNKTVIKKMIQELGKFKVNRISNNIQTVQQPYTPVPTNVLPVPPRYSSSTKKPKIEEIYRADDLQKGRMTEIEIRLKEKQEEMDKMLNNKKPTDIDFTDKKSGLNDTKLASSDMERLLAEALSSRQQELDQVKLNNEQQTMGNNINAEEWIKGTPTKPGSTNKEVKRPVENANKQSLSQEVQDIQKKSVTFNDKDNTKIRYENELDVSDLSDHSVKMNDAGDYYDDDDDVKHNDDDVKHNDNNDNEEGIQISILSKLKKNTFKPLNTVYTNDVVNNSNAILYKTIPLDAIMNNDDDDNDNDNYENNETNGIGSNYKSFEYNSHKYSKSRIAGETGEYKKLEEKVNEIRNEIEAIKSMQEKILHIITNVKIESNKVDV
jgi:hypothetical protein